MRYDHYMTIQSSEGAVQTDDGSIARQDAWITIEEFKNIRCHIQEKSKDTVTERFSRTDEEHRDLIYHENTDLYNYNPDDTKNQTQLRIIVNKNDPRQPISFPVSDENSVEIYDFMGHVEQVKRRRRFRKYILRCQRNNRWSI